MKKVLAILIFCFCAFLPKISALELENGIVYSVLDDETVQIDDYTGSLSTLEIPSVIEGKKVVEIGNYAFSSNTVIEKVILPDTIKVIGYAAFANAKNLEFIDLGEGLETIETYAFQNVSLTEIDFPDSLTTIDNYIFYGVTTLQELHIPKNVQTIKSNPAYNTTIERFSVDDSNAYFTVQDDILLSKDLTSLIGYPPGKDIVKYQIPESVISINDYAFATAEKLLEITIPDMVTSLGEGSFAKSGITQITIPKSVNEISFFLFYQCKNLVEVTVNGNLNLTGYEMFQSCPALKKVIFNGNINRVNSRTFHDCSVLTDVIFNGDVNEIWDYAFLNCPSIQNIAIPNSVKSVGAEFLSNSNENASYRIPSSLTLLSNGSYKLLYQLELINNTYLYSEASTVVDLVNQQRTNNGLSALIVDKELTEAAMTRARELALLFEHERPTGESIYTVNDMVVGENIAAGQSTAISAMNSWMNSSGHRANILDASYQAIGVGSFYQNGVHYWVQLFSTNVSTNPSVSTENITTASELEKISYDNIYNIQLRYDSDDWFEGEYVYKIGEEHKVEFAGITNGGWSYVSAEVSPNSFAYISSDASVVEVDENGTIIGKKIGSATVTATFAGKQEEIPIRVIPNSTSNLVYKSYIQGNGWESEFLNEDQISGTTGLGKQLEAFQIYLTNRDYPGEIWYRSKSSGSDWESDWRESGEISGTYGKRLEAIQIKLFSNVSLYYNVYYRVYVQNRGWLGWARNGESAGTSGYGYRIEAIEIKLVPKYTYFDTGGVAYLEKKTTNVVYQTQVQNKGWLATVSNGATSGTTGSGLRMETMKISLDNQEYSGSIEYRSHIQNKGWETTWKKDGEESGTVNKGLRLEAVQIRLTGEIANYYDVYYRVHSQNKGWLGWAKNGESAGTSGYGYRVEAIEIQLVKKGNSAPGSTAQPYVKYDKTKVTYQTQVQNKGWLVTVSNGATSGTTGSGLRMETLKISLDDQGYSGSIEYRSHIQNKGWETTWKKDGEESGTVNKGLRLEAVQIRLTGEIANYYDVYYRVHSQNKGWLGWAKNGESAGTSGYGYRVEAIEIQLIKKGNSAPGSTKNHYYSK